MVASAIPWTKRGVVKLRQPFKFWWAPTISLERLIGIVSEWSIHLIRGMYRSGPWAAAGGGPMSGEAELNNDWRLLTHRNTPTNLGYFIGNETKRMK